MSKYQFFSIDVQQDGFLIRLEIEANVLQPCADAINRILNFMREDGGDFTKISLLLKVSALGHDLLGLAQVPDEQHDAGDALAQDDRQAKHLGWESFAIARVQGQVAGRHGADAFQRGFVKWRQGFIANQDHVRVLQEDLFAGVPEHDFGGGVHLGDFEVTRQGDDAFLQVVRDRVLDLHSLSDFLKGTLGAFKVAKVVKHG